MLVGTSQCQIAMRPDGMQPECANRLNRVLGARVSTIAHPKATGGLAAGRLGTGISTPPLVQFIANRLLSGEREDNAEAWVEALSADVVPEKHDTAANGRARRPSSSACRSCASCRLCLTERRSTYNRVIATYYTLLNIAVEGT